MEKGAMVQMEIKRTAIQEKFIELDTMYKLTKQITRICIIIRPKSLKENSTKVLWTNLSRAKIKKQETPSCEFLVTIVGKKVGKATYIQKVKIGLHTYAVGQQGLLPILPNQKQAEVRKVIIIQILKIMKERQR